MASFLVTHGTPDQLGWRFVLPHRPVAGGRHPSQEIQLLDPGVSRKHFLIRFEEGVHVIRESQAANGVYVNGQRVKEHPLQHGDQVRVGSTVMVYHTKDEEEGTDHLQRQRRGERLFREGGTLLHPRDNG